VNWFCSYYLYINDKKSIIDYNRFYAFLQYFIIYNPLKFLSVTRFLVTPLLVTRYYVTLFSNTLKLRFLDDWVFVDDILARRFTVTEKKAKQKQNQKQKKKPSNIQKAHELNY